MLRSIARAALLRRLLQSSSRHRRSPYGRPRHHRRHRRSGGHFIGPFPAYTRRGPRSRVTVTGCCLPIPLGIIALPLAALGARRATRR